MATPINDIVRLFEVGKLKMPIKTFTMEEIAEAHKFIEHDGHAKVAVLVS